MRLYKRGDTWWVSVYVDGKRTRVSTRCHDRRAAETAARELERRAADPTHHAAAETTLDDALKLAKDNVDALVKTGRRSAGTKNYYGVKLAHVARLLGLRKLASLTAADVREYEHARRGEDAREHTIAKERQALRVALRLALEAGLWPGPVERVVPRGFDAEYTPRDTWLTPAQLDAVLAQLAPDRAARVCWIVATGARWSESEAALRADVAADLSSVHIRGTKSRDADRVVPVVGPFRALLERAIRDAAGRLDAKGRATGLLFGAWTSPVLVLARACRLAGVHRVTPNDLRRTTASWLVQAGVPDSIAARVLGHTTTRMVRQVYGRTTTASLGAAVAERFPGCDTGVSAVVSQGAEAAQKAHG